MLKASNNTRPDVLAMRFNQDYSCFSVGSATGFSIFNCEPFQETAHRYFGSRAGIGIVEMLFRCNILALVGGGQDPHWPTSKVVLWDDDQAEAMFELEHQSPVLNVRQRRDMVGVVLQDTVLVYSGPHADQPCTQLHQFDTAPNPSGMLSFCPHSTSAVLVVPSTSVGDVLLASIDVRDPSLVQQQTIAAHDNPISHLTLSFDGSRLASSSAKGTLIRIFCTETGSLLQELRRGISAAAIFSLAFTIDATAICCTSDAGTVHVFSLAAPAPNPLASVDQKYRVVVPHAVDNNMATIGRQRHPHNEAAPHSDAITPNSRSVLSFFGDMLPDYFSSEWSFAQWRGASAPCICAFTSQARTLVVVGSDLNFYKCAYLEEGGECKMEETHFFGHRCGSEKR